MEKLMILDGNSLMYRAFYAVPLLSNSDGIYTNAIYGFSNMVLKMKEELKPDYIVCTFDKKAKTFRHEEYDDYKAGRKKMPEELIPQFDIIKKMLELLDINIYELDGFEADDIIGTLAKYAEKKSVEVYIITGDRDALQLASENIKVVITKKGVTEVEIYNEKRMIDELGVTPTQFIDVKGLMGDKSDNIKGVPGIGEKTAYKLIQTYGSVEEVLKNVEEISGKKLKENLITYSEQAIFSKKLATIMTNVPIEFDFEDIKSTQNYNKIELKAMLIKLQMKTLIDKLKLNEDVDIQSIKKIEFNEVSDLNSLESLIKSLVKDIYLTFTLKNKEKYSTIEIENIFLSNDENNYVIKFNELIKENSAKELLKGFLENETILKNGHDIKDAIKALRRVGITLKGLNFDTALAGYLLDSSRSNYHLKDLIEGYLGESVNDITLEDLVKLNFYLPKLTKVLKEKIESANMNYLMYDVELKLTEALASMEALGFRVNEEMLDSLGMKFSEEIATTEKEIFDMAEEKFNINSPKQLGKILFEKLDLPVIKKTKTGYSTNAEVLEKLADKHPIIDKITYFRQLSKLYSTYVEGLKHVIDKDKSIHSSFNQTVTTTGRLSSTEPNLQNIPIKYEMGREIRKVFIPSNEDSILLSADYSQIELRVLAHMAKDQNMIAAFKEHSDIHTKTASEVFKVALDNVTPIMRSRAKAVNFGIVYGISDFSLAQDLKISKKEAKEYMDIYFERYPKIREYLEGTKNEAIETGAVITILNRRRFIPEIKSSNKIVKALGERLAMNAPIQGSAADIIKLAMVNVYNKLENSNLRSRIILQVHDELILNVLKDELDVVRALVKEEMEKVLELEVPLEVSISIGKTWYEAK
ncbi:DNA polymerase I [Clostridium cavendishii DSM 21758]|uniref:DNA polymerase I n=1 Tax=Clostridium cavendishii DSM 21758 TaxID=1121302 RepID=A0A1M6NSF6_9CLOT|nr:DNA polymerase I [Clostridium cavendishii]SHJ98522.1 DNA polymerase I [Clostridium cavendishii DSM 21758]